MRSLDRFVLGMALSASLLPGLATAVGAPSQKSPANGREVLESMRAAYVGRWYTALIFVQKTAKPGPDGKEKVETWYESLRQTDAAGTQLRIDAGPPANGNGVIYTATETLRFREGKLASTGKGGNALLPLIEGVYVQPLERTMAELTPTGVDLERAVLPGRWEKRPVWIVGASSSTDLRSPQIWVDRDRRVVVRAILAPVPGAPLMDIRIRRWVRLGGGWLGTRCEFLVDGKLDQAEDYRDWKAGVDLPDALFDAATFRSARHWAATDTPSREENAR